VENSNLVAVLLLGVLLMGLVVLLGIFGGFSGVDVLRGHDGR
jgi:hypothetical protein